MPDSLRLSSDPALARFGFWHLGGLLSRDEAVELADLARWVCAEAPLARPAMKTGQPLRVRVTSLGDVGWWADAAGGYRYVDRHPVTGRPWPKIPTALRLLGERALRAASAFGGDLPAQAVADAFDTCLINYYDADASLGWHQDLTEADRRTPIVNLSVGAPAAFDITLDEVEHRAILESGDAVVMAGQARGARHRIEGLVEPGLFSQPSPLAAGRLSFTLRRARAMETR